MNHKIPDEQGTEELLQMEGIMAKGYGCAAKYAMQDKELDISAKGLYAYLCSLTGGGRTTWLRRDNILKVLKLSKTTYYKVLGYLTDAGYITVTPTRMAGKWDRNVYTIVSNPKRFTEAQAETGESQLQYRGMMSAGFGMIPRLAMQDPRMSIKEKALYAYMLCYANAGTSAFPQVSTIISHLKISTDSYQKYMKTLEKLGYIIKTQRRTEGRFGVFDYYICEQPAPDRKKWDTAEQDTVIPLTPPPPEKWDTVKWDTVKQDTDSKKVPHPKKWDTEKWDRTKPDTKSLDSNKITQTTSIYSHTPSIPKEEENHPLPRQRKKQQPLSTQEIRREVLSNNGIPQNYLFDTQKLSTALKIVCGFEEGVIWHFEKQQKECETVFEALRLMCCRPKTKVRQKYLESGQVLRMINERCIEIMPYGPDMTSAFEYLVDAYVIALQERASNQEAPLRHPIAYAKYVIWDAMQLYKPEDQLHFMA